MIREAIEDGMESERKEKTRQSFAQEQVSTLAFKN
jgi:hypothetical protein